MKIRKIVPLAAAAAAVLSGCSAMAPAPDYDARPAREIEQARADFAAGRFITLGDLMKESGLE